MNKQKPQIGDLCKFWNDDSSSYAIGIVDSIKPGTDFPYRCEGISTFSKCEVYVEPQQHEFLDKCAISVAAGLTSDNTMVKNLGYEESLPVSTAIARFSYQVAKEMLAERRKVFNITYNEK